MLGEMGPWLESETAAVRSEDVAGGRAVGAQAYLLEMVALEHQEGPVEAQACHWVDQVD